MAHLTLSPSNIKKVVLGQSAELCAEPSEKTASGPFVPELLRVCPFPFAQKATVKLAAFMAQSFGFAYLTYLPDAPFIALPLMPAVDVNGLSAGKLALMLSTAFLSGSVLVPSNAM